MKSLQSFFIIGLLLAIQFSFAQFTDDINSNRPGRSMMAFSVGKTVIIVSHDDIDHEFRKITMKNGRVINSSFF